MAQNDEVRLTNLRAKNKINLETLLRQGYTIPGEAVSDLRRQLMLEALFDAILNDDEKRAMELKFEGIMEKQIESINEQIKQHESQQRQQALLQGVPLGQRPY